MSSQTPVIPKGFHEALICNRFLSTVVSCNLLALCVILQVISGCSHSCTLFFYLMLLLESSVKFRNEAFNPLCVWGAKHSSRHIILFLWVSNRGKKSWLFPSTDSWALSFSGTDWQAPRELLQWSSKDFHIHLIFKVALLYITTVLNSLTITNNG